MMLERVPEPGTLIANPAVLSRVPVVRLAAVLVLCGACGVRPGWVPEWAWTRDGAPAVGLLTSGSAFERSGVRRQVVRALERESKRRVVVLDGSASADDPGVKELVARITKENPSLARYDWRERRCAAHADVLTAIQRNVEAVYRVSLDYAERTRPATDAEIARPDARSRNVVSVLGALHLVAPKTVREERLSGSVAVSSFAPGGSRRETVSRTGASVEPSLLTSRIDVEDAVAAATAKLPAVRAPQWDTVAKKLVAAGCPFLALEVWDARLAGVRAHRRVRKAALAAIAQSLDKHTPAQLADETSARVMAAIHEGDLDWARSMVEQYEADPARQPATVRELKAAVATARRRAAQEHGDEGPAPGEETQTCNALCSIQMVELCNNNKVLWNSNHARWEPVPCGTRREEPFVAECYRQQWLAGTFDNACLRPCESTPDGRDRLIRLLRSSGCLRLKPS
jgi:hypothetical protein